MDTSQNQTSHIIDTSDLTIWPNKVAHSLSKFVYPISRVINGIGVTVVVIMMLLTTADVALRYIFSRPITGSLELTEFMMIVLVSFGLAYAAIKKEHINIDFVTQKFSSRTKAVINAITCFFSIGVFSIITWRSVVYAESLRNGHYLSSALYIPKYPFAYIVAFGAATLSLVLVCHLFEYVAQAVGGKRWWTWLGLLVLIAIFAVLFSIPIWEPGLRGHITPVTAGLIGVALLVILMSSGMWIGVVMALPGFLGMVYITGLLPGLTIMGTTPYSESSSYTMSQVPLFVLMGLLCYYSKLSQDLYNTAYKWFGHLRGGLAITSIAACTAFGAVCGSAVAEVATAAMVALPEMKRHRYDASFASACVAAGGGIGSLIPPSIIMIIYGILTEQSIGKIYIAGIIPGILQAILYMLTIYVLCKRNPILGPCGEKSKLTERITSLKDSWGMVALFILVIGGIYFGVFTPTEAGGVGAFGAFLFALSKRQLTWKGFVDSLFETGKTTAVVILLLIGAVILGYFIAVARLPATLSNFIASLGLNRYIIFSIVVFFYLMLGCFLSAIAMVVLTVPIIFPIIVALGFDPIWFGIQLVILVEVATITPPYALNVFIIHGIAKDIPVHTIYRGVVPYIITATFLLILLTIFPQIVTILPSTMR